MENRRKLVLSELELGGSFPLYETVTYQVQALVVQNVDNVIRWINLYPLDSAITFSNIYPLDSDLSAVG